MLTKSAATKGNLLDFRAIPFRNPIRRNYSYHHSRSQSPNPKELADFVRHQCQLGFPNLETPISLFSQLHSLYPRPPIRVFNELFTAMSKIKPHPPFATLLSLLRQLELSGLRPDRHSVGIQLNCFCRLGSVDFAFSLLGKRLKLGFPMNKVIFTTLINGLVLAGKMNVAVGLLDKIVKLGLKPDIVTYGSMLKGLCRGRESKRAIELLRKMELTEDCKPNVVIYSMIIDCLCKDESVDQAVEIFGEMKSKGVLPNVVTYNTLMRGLFEIGNYDTAKGLLREMLESKIAPGLCTFNMLIDTSFKEGMADEARDIIELLTERSVNPYVITEGMDDQMEGVEKLLKLMSLNGYEPDVVTLSTLINGYCKSGRVDKALDVFQSMRVKGIPPNVVTYNTLLDALFKYNRPAFAFELFERMEVECVKPTVVTYNIVVAGLRNNGQLDKAINILNAMKDTGLRCNIVTTLIGGLIEADQFKGAVDVFSILLGNGVKPDVHAYNTMIKGFCKRGMLAHACGLLEEMGDAGCSPNECTYNTIITGFLNNNDVAKAFEFLTSMKSLGFAVDADTASLISSLLTSDGVTDADKALLQEFSREHNGTEKADEANVIGNLELV